MKLFNKIANGAVSQTVNSVGNMLDNLITNDEERANVKNKFAEIITSHTDSLVNSAKEVVLAEATGNWLQRSWRPLIMLAFAFIVVFEYFFSPIFGLPKANLPEKFWDLLQIGFGGYVIGRSVEKVTDSIANNFDKLPGKKDKSNI